MRVTYKAALLIVSGVLLAGCGSPGGSSGFSGNSGGGISGASGLGAPSGASGLGNSGTVSGPSGATTSASPSTPPPTSSPPPRRRAPAPPRPHHVDVDTPPPAASGAWCSVTVHSFMDYDHDEWLNDVYVHSNQPYQSARASAQGYSWSYDTDSSGYADVYLNGPSAGAQVTVTVGGATCSGS